MGCAVTTGFGIIENDAGLKMGENIVIYGSGGVGLNVIQAAKLRSAKKIIAIDLFDNRLDLSKKVGATHIINSAKEDVDRRLDQIMDNDKIDIINGLDLLKRPHERLEVLL